MMAMMMMMTVVGGCCVAIIVAVIVGAVIVAALAMAESSTGSLNGVSSTQVMIVLISVWLRRQKPPTEQVENYFHL